MTQPTPTQFVETELTQAVEQLEQVIQGITEVKTALRRHQENDSVISEEVLRDIRGDLIALGTPLQSGSLSVHLAFQEIAQLLGIDASQPEYVWWLTGVNWKQPGVVREQERAQKILAVHEWLDPYLDQVSSHTRTVIGFALQRDDPIKPGLGPISSLTREQFIAQLERPGGGYVGAIRGLGASRVVELRAAFGIVQE